MLSFACVFLLRPCLRVSVRVCKYICARQLSASAATVSPRVSQRSSQNFLFISSAAARSQSRPAGFHLKDSETPHRGTNHVSSLSALRHAVSTVFESSRLVSRALFQGLGLVSDPRAFLLRLVFASDWADSGFLMRISQDSANQRMQLLLFVTPKVTPCPVISS